MALVNQVAVVEKITRPCQKGNNLLQRAVSGGGLSKIHPSKADAKKQISKAKPMTKSQSGNDKKNYAPIPKRKQSLKPTSAMKNKGIKGGGRNYASIPKRKMSK